MPLECEADAAVKLDCIEARLLGDAGDLFQRQHLGLVGAVASPGNNVSASGGDLILGARMSLEAFPSLPNPLARVAVVDVDEF